MPCHNAEKFVGEAIESVLSQTYENIELIVVNDGSTDRSEEVLEKYKGRRVVSISEKCGSASKARNRALREAKGEYIKFCDADDLISPEMIERQVGRLNGRQDAVAMSEWGRFYNDDVRSFRKSPQSCWKTMSGIEWLVEALMDAQPMMQVGMFLIPKILTEKAGPWIERSSPNDDFEYFCRLFCETEEILFVPETMLFYRSGIRGSLSAQKSPRARESECESVLLGTSYILKKRKDKQAALACANVCQHLIFDLYPKHSDLRQKLAQRVRECGKANIQPYGGRYFQKLRPWIGWKMARILQRAVGR